MGTGGGVSRVRDRWRCAANIAFDTCQEATPRIGIMVVCPGRLLLTCMLWSVTSCEVRWQEQRRVNGQTQEVVPPSTCAVSRKSLFRSVLGCYTLEAIQQDTNPNLLNFFKFVRLDSMAVDSADPSIRYMHLIPDARVPDVAKEAWSIRQWSVDSTADTLRWEISDG
jgi:hypothetical protein